MLISNDELREEHVPPPFAPWEAIGPFAVSYPWDQDWSSRRMVSDFGLMWRGVWRASGRLPESLPELRACLFEERYRWCYAGEDPDFEALAYVWALIERIRAVVRRRAGSSA